MSLDPLFTEQPDTVDFDDVQAGTYEAGTQYDALASDDTVTFASSQAEANQAGYDTDILFNGGSGEDSLTGRGLDDKIAGGADNDTIAGNDGDDLLIGDNTEVGTPGSAFILGGRDVPRDDYDVDVLWNQEIDGFQVNVTPFSDLDGGTVGDFGFEYQGNITRGIGVQGGDPEINGIEGIEVDFGGMALESVTVGLRALFAENQPGDGVETATWVAYLDGVQVATGDEDAVAGSPDGRAEFTIDVPGGFDTLQFFSNEPGADFHLEYIEGETPGTGGELGDDNIDGGDGDDLIYGDNVDSAGEAETFVATGNQQGWNDAGVTLTAYDFDGSDGTVTYLSLIHI